FHKLLMLIRLEQSGAAACQHTSPLHSVKRPDRRYVTMPFRKGATMPNVTIYPYLLEGTAWVFDDERHRLKEEAFILGTDEVIARIVEAKAIPSAAEGVALTFGDEPLDHDVELNWITPREAAEARHYAVDWLPHVGNWYRGMIFGQDMVCWICPALFLYFPEA